MEGEGVAEMELAQVRPAKIFPGVGIARLGNSPDEFYIGPEAPGQVPKLLT